MSRSMFNLSNEHKLSLDLGYLVPVFAEEVLPGDTFIHSSSALARVAPLVNPVMHRVELRLHHFYVPNRIIWDGWEGFITGRDDTVAPVVTNAPVTDLTDHLGVDPDYIGDVNALPVYAYNLIWNEFYRDQDLQTERAEDDMTLARICWEKDYLTVARPSPQQGTPLDIPLSGQGTIPVRNLYRADSDTGTAMSAIDPGDSYPDPGRTTGVRILGYKYGGGAPMADFSDATGGIDINDLRRSMALQRIAEARAMYGSRYIDYLRFLGINPSDGRLDRPEYLGGGKQIINFSEVLATAEGTSTEVGDMFGHGIVATRSRRYRKMFEEHGWVLTLMSARPKTVYQDGVPRRFLRSEAMDYWQKELEILPWQEIKTAEVHPSGNVTDVFGYVPRYEEYRFSPSFVSGTFRKGTEEDWHYARKFASLPLLNGSFVECTPTDRVYSDANMPELLCNVRNSVLAKRLVRGTAQIGGL